MAAAVLVAVWTVSKIPGMDTGPVALVRILVVTGGLFIAVVLLHLASPRPPRKWIAEPS